MGVAKRQRPAVCKDASAPVRRALDHLLKQRNREAARRLVQVYYSKPPCSQRCGWNLAHVNDGDVLTAFYAARAGGSGPDIAALLTAALGQAGR